MPNKKSFDLIVGLNTYKKLGALEDENRLRSGYITLNLIDAIELRNFQRNWSLGNKRTSPIYLPLSQPYLTHSQDIELIEDSYLASPFKLDGITFLKERPSEIELHDINGYLVLYRESFFFQFEDFNELGPSEFIYRSNPFGYIRIQEIINELLSQLDYEDPDNRGFETLNKCIF